jgi:MFS family permease
MLRSFTCGRRRKDGLLKKPRVFYGYWILAACFVFCTVSSGSALAAFSFILKSLETAMGWNRTEMLAAFTVLLISMALSGPLIGWLAGRYGAKRIIALGALLEAGGLVLLSQLQSLWQYYIGYAIVGVGVSAASQITTTFIVSQWFSRRRGLAIGIMSTGLSVPGIIYAFLVGVYLIPHFGWSTTYLVLAANVAVLIIPLSLLVIRDRPSDMGLFPDGADGVPSLPVNKFPAAAASGSTSTGLSSKMALVTPAFWLMAAAFFLLSNHLGIGQTQTPYLEEMGFSVGIAASSFSIISVASVFGMFFYGWLCDKIPVKFVTVIGLCILAMGIVIFLNIGTESPVWTVWIYSAVFGFGAGSWIPTMSMLTSTTFGLSSYGAIFGMVSLFQSLGSGAGPFIAGAFYDATGAFRGAYILILALVVLAIPIILAVRRPAPIPAGSTLKTGTIASIKSREREKD